MNEWPPSDDAQERTLYWESWARYRAAPNGEEKQQLLREAAQLRRARVQRYADFCLGRHLYAQDPFAEELVWFWFNHFNVFWQKDHIGMALPDYVETAIRPHVQGRFGDMLLSTMTHPAMLMYLDNAQNFAGRINENYARELLELHTLGVRGGYAQEDVQQVARVLTGLGVHNIPRAGSPGDAPSRDRFWFNPLRHDAQSKQVLGQLIVPSGMEEMNKLAALLVAHPSTAQHIARRLCTYFVADEPDVALVGSVASVFQSSGGDLQKVTAAVAKAMAEPRYRPGKFKDPLRYVVSSARLLAQGRTLPTVQPFSRWLNALGQPMFQRSTPDGYPLRGADWVSPGQLTRRFATAREMTVHVTRVLGQGADSLKENPYLLMLERSLPEPIRAVVAQASSPVDRASLLLSSPNHMYW